MPRLSCEYVDVRERRHRKTLHLKAECQEYGNKLERRQTEGYLMCCSSAKIWPALLENSYVGEERLRFETIPNMRAPTHWAELPINSSFANSLKEEKDDSLNVQGRHRPQMTPRERVNLSCWPIYTDYAPINPDEKQFVCERRTEGEVQLVHIVVFERALESNHPQFSILVADGTAAAP